jgi:hypothetical protein
MLIKKAGKKCGAALLEATIVLAVLVFLLLGLADLYFIFSCYANINQITREGVISSMTLKADFARNDSCADTTHTNLNTIYEYCSTGLPGDNTCGHQMVHWKVQKALKTNSIFNTRNYGVKTNCLTVGNQMRISVSVSAEYYGFLPLFRGIPINSDHLGVISNES